MERVWVNPEHDWSFDLILPNQDYFLTSFYGDLTSELSQYIENISQDIKELIETQWKQ